MFNLGNKKFNIKKRLKRLAILYISILGLLCIRLYYIQKKFNPTVNTNSTDNYIQKENIINQNYLLLDRNGDDLSEYVTKYRLVIDTRAFTLNSTNQNLQNLLAFNYIMKSEESEFSFDNIVKVKGKLYYDISRESYEKIKNIEDIKGIYIYEYYERAKQEAWRIENMIASTKARNPYDGNDNYEKSDNSLEMIIQKELLENLVPKIVFEKDINGVYKDGKIDYSSENLNVKLTLDKEMQESIRKILNDEKYSEFKNIGAVLIEADSGKILSLAQKDESQPNIVLGGGGINGYEPGSIFKIITLEAAMEYHNVKLGDEFSCTGKICSKEKIHGKITIKEAFKVSCNDVFANLAAIIGKEDLIDFAKNQGVFSQVLGMDMTTGMESPGAVSSDENAIGVLAIGQSMQSNLLQMSAIITTIVNEGKYVKPYIVDSFENFKGETIKLGKSINNNIISKSVADDLKIIMNRTVADGTAQVAKIKGVEVGAKTGTSQTTENSHGWFVGYFKHKEQYYILGVFIPNIGDKNYKGEKTSGGNTAGPVFKDIILEFIKK